MAKVVIIEDEEELATVVKLELQHEGFSVITALDGRDGLEAIENEKPDIVLLDVMLPRLSGLEVLRKMRGELSLSTPVILVTARSETIDKVDGLNSGADDYITKPFQIEELLARINALLRRSTGSLSNNQPMAVKNGDIEINLLDMSVKYKGENVVLTKVEYLLLKKFMENIGKVLSRDEIISSVWGEEYYIEENIVDVYVRHLRAKFSPSVIDTVRGLGYCHRQFSQPKAASYNISIRGVNFD